MKFNNIIILIICSLSFCAACIRNEPPPATTTYPPSATPVSPTDTPTPPIDSPVQTTHTFIEVTTETTIEFPSGEFYNGSFLSTLIINKDGTWRTDPQGLLIGIYKLEGKQVTFKDKSAWCRDLGDGIYTWEFVDGILILKTVEDACDTRVRWLTLPYYQQ